MEESVTVDKTARNSAVGGEAAKENGRNAVPEALQNDLLFAAMRLRRMAIVFSDPNQADNPIVYCNNAFIEQSGYPVGEIIGRNCRFLQGPATDRDTVRRIREALAAGQGFNEELYNYRRDGKGFWNALYVSPITDGDGRVLYFLGSQTDVTERKTSALQQQSRLDTVGAMAAGVDHQFSGLMTTVLSNIAQVHGAIVDERQRGWLKQAEVAAQQAGRLTQQLLALTQHSTLDVREADLNEAVRNLDGLLAQIVNPAVEIRLDLSPEPSMAKIDLAQFDLALVHLVRNASEAMPKGGRLTVRVWDFRSWEPAVGQGGQAWVELSVSDEGEGMSSKVSRLATEPFYSTKKQGKGVGLSLVQTFVEQSAGRMQIETSPGRGTNVRLSFPRIEEPL